MGTIRKILASTELPERERHNSRLFVDLSEQVHVHFRELRNQFSVEEFFEYASTITKSTKDLKRYLLWHPDYAEEQVFDNIVVALGPEQQTRPLRAGAKPHQSTYFPQRLQIELQGEKIIDEIHIHYRDYRLAMSRETFREFARAMAQAVATLDNFLEHNTYEREQHPFRAEVVKDQWYEARQWKRTGKTKISVRRRLQALLWYVGGDKLVQAAGYVARRLWKRERR